MCERAGERINGGKENTTKVFINKTAMITSMFNVVLEPCQHNDGHDAMNHGDVGDNVGLDDSN